MERDPLSLHSPRQSERLQELLLEAVLLLLARLEISLSISTIQLIPLSLIRKLDD